MAGYERSGQGQKEYARRFRVGLSTLGLWLRQRRSGHGARLVEVEMPAATCETAYRVMMPTGMRVKIGRGFDPQELKELLGVVREAS